MNKQERLEDIAYQAFKGADIDNSNSIDQLELKAVIEFIAQRMQIRVSDEDEIEEILEDFDENGDGVLQYEEFKEFIKELFDEEEVQEELPQNPKTSITKRRSTNFIFSLKEKKISLNGDFSEMFLNQQKLNRVSVTLQKNQSQIIDEVKSAEAPKNVKDKKKWLIEQEAYIRKRQSSFCDYMDMKKKDEDYLIHCEIGAHANKKISSVYTNLSPQNSLNTTMQSQYNRKSKKLHKKNTSIFNQIFSNNERKPSSFLQELKPKKSGINNANTTLDTETSMNKSSNSHQSSKSGGKNRKYQESVSSHYSHFAYNPREEAEQFNIMFSNQGFISAGDSPVNTVVITGFPIPKK